MKILSSAKEWLIFGVLAVLLVVSATVTHHVLLSDRGFLNDCGTSPFGDFKDKYCDSDAIHGYRVDFRGWDVLSQPTVLLRVLALKTLPIYDGVDVQFEAIGIPIMSSLLPISAPLEIDSALSKTSSTTPAIIVETILTVIDYAYLLALAYFLTTFWLKQTRKHRVAVILVLLFGYKYIALVTLPIIFFLRTLL